MPPSTKHDFGCSSTSGLLFREANEGREVAVRIDHILVAVAVVIEAAACASVPNAQTSIRTSRRVAAAEFSLTNADVFETAVIGAGGAPSRFLAPFGRVLKSRHRAEIAQQIFDSATPEGKLYALCLARSIDRNLYDAYRQRLLEMDSAVETRRGCSRWHVAIGEFVAAMERDRWCESFLYAFDVRPAGDWRVGPVVAPASIPDDSRADPVAPARRRSPCDGSRIVTITAVNSLRLPCAYRAVLESSWVDAWSGYIEDPTSSFRMQYRVGTVGSVVETENCDHFVWLGIEVIKDGTLAYGVERNGSSLIFKATVGWSNFIARIADESEVPGLLKLIRTLDERCSDCEHFISRRSDSETN